MGNIRDEISNELRKNWPIFVIHQNREFIFSEIELLKDFNSEQESLLETQLNNFNLRVDDQLKNLDEDSKNMVSENYSDEYWKFKEIFPNLYRCSHFITCFSYFEYHLTELCKILKNLFDNDILLDLSDLKGKNDIDRIKKYLKKVIRINCRGS